MKYEIAIRLVSFLVVFCGVARWEPVAPRLQLTTSKKKRWINNLFGH